MFIGQFIYNKYKGRTPIDPRTYTTINHGYDIILWYGNPISVCMEQKLEYKYKDDIGKYNKRYGGSIKEGMKNTIKQDNGVIYLKVYEKETYGPIKHNYLDVGSMKSYIYPCQKPHKLLERIICISTI